MLVRRMAALWDGVAVLLVQVLWSEILNSSPMYFLPTTGGWKYRNGPSVSFVPLDCAARVASVLKTRDY
jgi:hypothetical protein